MAKQYIVRINKGIAWTGAKPWYDAYQEEKFQVKDNSITDYIVTDKEWTQKYLGTSTATIEKRHCAIVKEVIEQFSPAVLSSDSEQIKKFHNRYAKKVVAQIEENNSKVMEADGSPKVDLTKQPTHFTGMMEQHSDKVEETTDQTTIGDLNKEKEGFERIEETKEPKRQLQDKVAKPETPKLERPPAGVVPRYLHDEKRHGDIAACIIRYAQSGRKIEQDWIDEYNELTDKIDARRRLKESQAKK